jgi:hypothetical protein
MSVWLMAEPDTDDIFAKIRLVPLCLWEPVADVGEALKGEGSRGAKNGHHQQQSRPVSFPKTLTQSNTNNGGTSGFSMP